ncbi:hypothetical protein ANN_06793 [Periplaneta americana]|uniref:Uncharacterized protein n=1 Tax=Periplaneta americana TaxID=6978 RepID=A0ABQ8TGF1_PERAM|nr:hypothetical protein ANN_06793 [Periplaneta americana]
MHPGSSTDSYSAFAHIRLRENAGKTSTRYFPYTTELAAEGKERRRGQQRRRPPAASDLAPQRPPATVAYFGAQRGPDRRIFWRPNVVRPPLQSVTYFSERERSLEFFQHDSETLAQPTIQWKKLRKCLTIELSYTKWTDVKGFRAPMGVAKGGVGEGGVVKGGVRGRGRGQWRDKGSWSVIGEWGFASERCGKAIDEWAWREF